MRNRNTILALVAAGLLTVVAFTPALPEGLQCSDYPNIDRCPLYGVFGNPGRPLTIKCLPCTSGMPRLTKHHYH